MIKILCLVYSRTDAGSFYRAGGVMPDLSKKLEARIDTFEWREIVLDWQIIAMYDIIFMFRPFNNTALNLCSFIKDLGKPLWIDYDDNLFEIPSNNRYYKHIHHRSGKI